LGGDEGYPVGEGEEEVLVSSSQRLGWLRALTETVARKRETRAGEKCIFTWSDREGEKEESDLKVMERKERVGGKRRHYLYTSRYRPHDVRTQRPAAEGVPSKTYTSISVCSAETGNRQS